MKFIFFALISYLVAAAPPACNKGKAQAACYQGKLEIKGVCSNYTLSVTSGTLEGTIPQWTDEQTGKSYKHVFALANPCSFPESIKEGDTFYFTVAGEQKEDCMVCKAYYPTPGNKINIQVVPGPCANPSK